ncbi:MAG: pyruvate carboxyltransferase [Actinobacteria bacterium]|nr:pyruvate carboxyltransferase [Cyanobacteriota bacterium]MCL5771931.1 pyruvate carboxyltransferase [Actinomycetota bacterium]
MKESLSYHTNNWFVSSWNYFEKVTEEFNFPKKVQFHDVTLRDGEQQEGLVFRKDEKVKIAEQLAEVGIDRIEAGMPVVSKEDEDAIREIVKRNLGPKIFTFSRCVIDDVKMAADCGVDGIVIEIPSSRHIIEKAYGWTVEKAMEMCIESTNYAKELGLYTVFFPVDMTRAEFDWFLEMIHRVSTEGHMDALGIVDTMGVLSPHAVGYMIKEIKKKISKPLEAHFHNDFNCAAANSVMAAAAGVEVIHTSICGIGERAGMAGYEEVAMMLKTMYGVDVNINFSKLYPTAKLMQELLKIQFPSTRPIVGDGIYAIESGIVTNWLNRVLPENDELEITPFHWNFVGQEAPKIVLGKHSGKASILNALEKINIKIDDDKIINEILDKVKNKASVKKNILNEKEFKEIVEETI